MRIISKFKDYYDSAMGFGIDAKCVYVRHTEEVPGKYVMDATDEKRVDIERATKAMFDRIERFSTFGSFNGPMPVYVGFCGKIYMGVQFTALAETPRTPTFGFRNSLTAQQVTSYAWSLNDFDEEALDDTRFNDSRFARYKTIREWFDSILDKTVVENVDLFTKHNMACFVKSGRDIWINPKLTDFSFQRRLDSFTAFQELYMFISGVLTQPDAKMVKIEDKHMVTSKGFDERSFRKEPTKRIK